MRLVGFVGAVSLVAILLDARPAEAIPAFAREYGVPCQTCHVVIGRRNEFGDVFRKRGYHWPDPERDLTARKLPPVGMDGVAAFSSFLPSTVPLAMLATFAAAYTNDPDAETRMVIAAPQLQLRLGGALGQNVGFYGTWDLASGPGELLIQASRLFDRPELSFRAGRFIPWTTLFKPNEALIAPFQLSLASVNGFSVSAPRQGLEYDGVFFDRTFVAAGVAQNAGLGSPIDYYYHVSHKFGGMDLNGREPDMDLETESIWDDLVLTLGHWGHYGHVDGADGEQAYLIRRFGLDLQLRFLEFNLWAGGMFGIDGDIAALRPVRSATWFVEASYELFSWMVFMYLYQFQDRTQVVRASQTHDVGVILLPLENIRVRIKYSFSDDRTRNDVAEAQVLVAF